ncbi:MAG: (2Fe-2S)-binding protein [Actinobacteria bacterium]|nr:(2Fe-2S)-binding protein [Actinomycetota bacterium]
MFACICHAVTEDRVALAAADGVRDVGDLGEITGAGTGCGSCLDRLSDLLDEGRSLCALAGLRSA